MIEQEKVNELFGTFDYDAARAALVAALDAERGFSIEDILREWNKQ